MLCYQLVKPGAKADTLLPSRSQRRLGLLAPQADQPGGGGVLHWLVGVAVLRLCHELLPQLFHMVVAKRQPAAVKGGTEALGRAVWACEQATAGKHTTTALLAAAPHEQPRRPHLCHGPARVMPSQNAVTLGHSISWLIRSSCSTEAPEVGNPTCRADVGWAGQRDQLMHSTPGSLLCLSTWSTKQDHLSPTCSSCAPSPSASPGIACSQSVCGRNEDVSAVSSCHGPRSSTICGQKQTHSTPPAAGGGRAANGA